MSDSDFLNEVWSEAWRPPERVPVWQWAENNIEGIPYSPMPGRFSVEHSPMLREVMQEIVNPRVRRVHVIAAVQSSKTTAIEVAMCYIIANMPGPTLWLTQTDDDARIACESRLRQIFDHCPPVRALYPEDRYKLRNTTLCFANDMTLWAAGAFNRKNLQMRSIRWLFGDETWLWPPGHMAEAEARTTAFGWLGKCVFTSQGGLVGDDTHNGFAATDQREWVFTCPECGETQPFQWKCVEWADDCIGEDGETNYRRVRETAVMKCVRCEHRFPDRDDVRRRLNATAFFLPRNPNAVPEYVGFHWNALATMSWGMLAELYLRALNAERMGDSNLLRQFWQKRLALPWDDVHEDFHVQINRSGYHMGDFWPDEGNVSGVPLRFLTVDVQRDCFYAVVRAWALDGSSRLMDCAMLHSWDDIDAMAARYGVRYNLVFVDCGYQTHEVYLQCHEHGWTALMGDKRATFTHTLPGGKRVERYYSPKRTVNLGGLKGRPAYADMYFWSNISVKDALFRLRRNTEAPLWELPSDVPQEYCEMLDSEYRVCDKGRWIWQQIKHRPNHYLDCEAMQVAAAVMLKLVGSESAQVQAGQTAAES